MGKRPGMGNKHKQPKDSSHGNYLRNSQVSRFYKVLNLLESSRIGLTVKELRQCLADRGLEVTERTIYRDLEGLRQAGFHVVIKDHGQMGGKKFLLDRGSSVTNYLLFSTQELFAMHVAKASMGFFGRSKFYEDFKSFFEKIFSKLNSQSKAMLEELEKDFQVEFYPKMANDYDENLLAIIRNACRQRFLICFTYHLSPAQTVHVQLSAPEFLYLVQGTLYLVARSQNCSSVKLYAISRMRSVQIENQVNANKVLDKTDFLQRTFGGHYGTEAQSISVQFDKEIADFVIERVWHSTQVNKLRPDGTLIVSFVLSISPELIRWIISFGSNAKVLEPQILRTQVFAEIVRMSTNYQVSDDQN